MRRSPRKKFVVCVRNERYPVLLELRKIYEQLPDHRSEAKGMIRIAADEDEDEALFPAECFMPIELSKDIEVAMESAELGVQQAEESR
jgi:hypothetical protein